MRIGLFTDTYFPQVSGVATSIRTLKTQLEKMGHTVFIFTTTDRDCKTVQARYYSYADRVFIRSARDCHCTRT